MFAKYVNGYIRTAKKRYDTDEEYVAAGYKPVEFTPMPEEVEGYHYVPRWEEQTDSIVQTWALVEDSEELTAEEIAAAIEEALA